MANSSTNTKPAKPSATFPLFPHATGRWAKKIRGKLYYFGPWRDPDAALQDYLDRAGDLHAGRSPEPEPESDDITVVDLCDQFLQAKKNMVGEEELSNKTLQTYYGACDLLVRFFGKTQIVKNLRIKDFERMRATAFRTKPTKKNKTTKPLADTTRTALMQQIQIVFNWGWKNDRLSVPVKFGDAFSVSKKKQRESVDAKKKERELTAEQIRALIDGGDVYTRAMVYLGINCGLGNSDIGKLTFSSLDLDGGWLTDRRQKTNVKRRAKLWPETVTALRAAIAARRMPKDLADADVVFITRSGNRYWRYSNVNDGKNHGSDAIAQLMANLFAKVGVNHGTSFYSLRRMVESRGSDCNDSQAVDCVMGHTSPGMGQTYQLTFPADSRLEAVADTIHAWLFPPATATAAEAEKGGAE